MHLELTEVLAIHQEAGLELRDLPRRPIFERMFGAQRVEQNVERGHLETSFFLWLLRQVVNQSCNRCRLGRPVLSLSLVCILFEVRTSWLSDLGR